MSRKLLPLVRALTPAMTPVVAYTLVGLLTLVMGVGLIALWNSLSRTPPASEGQSVKQSQARQADYHDLSDTYGRVNRTIFNKKTQTVFSTPQEFFADSGMTSFDSLKFDQVLRLPLNPHLVNGRRLTDKEIESIMKP